MQVCYGYEGAGPGKLCMNNTNTPLVTEIKIASNASSRRPTAGNARFTTLRDYKGLFTEREIPTINCTLRTWEPDA